MKRESSGEVSLKTRIRREAVRWSLLGLFATALFAIPCVLYSSKLSSERQIMVLAKAAARAFRPMILQDEIRDAQFKMRRALDLKSSESAIVFTPGMTAIYPIAKGDETPACKTPMTFCWGRDYRTLSILYPIYFDDEKQDSLFGYLQISTVPTVDYVAVAVLAALLIFTFLGQALGLSTTLIRSADQIGKAISDWATHLRTAPSIRPENLEAPVSELKPMQHAVEGLHLEIEELRKKSVREARAEAQLSMLREIGHDLKTPHALLAKHIALLMDTVESTGKPNPNEIRSIENTLKRLGDLIRQVRTIPSGQKNLSDEKCNLVVETANAISDFKLDPEVTAKGIAIHYESQLNDQPMVRLSKIGIYRILENLVRNAVEAVPAGEGLISITLRSGPNGRPALIVQDNGCGIDPTIKDQIFAFDFTTKLARGTGLGLGIVEKICNEYGATISVDSVVNQGTAFTVEFQPIEMFAEVSHG